MRFSNKFDENSVIKRMKYYMENYNFFTYIDTKDKINYTTSTKDRSCRFCKKKFSNIFSAFLSSLLLLLTISLNPKISIKTTYLFSYIMLIFKYPH